MENALSNKPLEHPQTEICGVRYSCFNREAASRYLFQGALSKHGGYVCVTGAHGVVTAQENAEFKHILNAAFMNTLDGMPVVLIARMRGFQAGRVTGRELVKDIIALDRDSSIRHIFFGATAAVTNRLIENLSAENANINVVAINPPFREINDAELDEVCTKIFSEIPTIVWIGLSTPKQEKLAARLARRCPQHSIVAIGAGFDFIAGLKPEAPRLATQLCLEWLFRLVLEPRRLLKRYCTVIPKFIYFLIKSQPWRRGGV